MFHLPPRCPQDLVSPDPVRPGSGRHETRSSPTAPESSHPSEAPSGACLEAAPGNRRAVHVGNNLRTARHRRRPAHPRSPRSNSPPSTPKHCPEHRTARTRWPRRSYRGNHTRGSPEQDKLIIIPSIAYRALLGTPSSPHPSTALRLRPRSCHVIPSASTQQPVRLSRAVWLSHVVTPRRPSQEDVPRNRHTPAPPTHGHRGGIPGATAVSTTTRPIRPNVT